MVLSSPSSTTRRKMNPITDLIFTLSWFILLVWAIRIMARGWGLMADKPVRQYKDGYHPMRDSGMYTTTVTKPVHPEMADVKPGEELMGVTFKNQSEDPLLQSLQERIDELDEDIEDEDDDGDVIVRV